MLARDTLEQILDHLDKSIAKLKEDTVHNPEFHMNAEDARDFFESQYETRLQNMLQSQKSDIHHLESGMKNKIIQRKNALLEKIT